MGTVLTRAPLAAELSQMPPTPERRRAVYALWMTRTKTEVARLTGLSLGQVGADLRWCMTHDGKPRKGRSRADRPAPETEREGGGGGRKPPPKEPPGYGFEEDDDGGARAWSTSPRITTLDQLLEACAVDLQRWQVERYMVNKWEVGAKTDDGDIVIEPLFQVKAWLKPNAAAPVEDGLARYIERIAARAQKLPAPRYNLDAGEYLVVPSMFDAHFNKRSADGAYTIERAAADFCAVADAAAARIRALSMPVERILFPAGNDALHADNLQGTTTDGTQLETAAEQRDAVDAVIEAYEYAIRRFAEVAPVDVIVVESNHDRYSMHWLGKVIEAMFKRAPHIKVDATHGPRKYYRYGATLIGLEHGDKVKPRDLAALMAGEAPHLWAATRYREWLRGHVHHSASMFYPITSDSGVTARVIPAMCPPDEYHILRGFVGSHRAAEVLYYHREYGPAGSFPVFVSEVAPVRVAELARAA